MRSLTVDIAIPVLNEEEELQSHVEKILIYIQGPAFQHYQIRLVIADNGSVDRTPLISKDLVARHPERVAYVRMEQKGVGRALKKAWGLSAADIVGYFDVDLATDLNHLPQALDALSVQGFDVVYGSRLHKLSDVQGRSMKREITSRLFNYLLQFYLGIHFSDGMCGFKFLKRVLLPPLMAGGAISDGWFFSTELLTVAEWQGFKLYELPIRWTDSSDSRVQIIPLATQYLAAMRMLKRRNPRRRSI